MEAPDLQGLVKWICKWQEPSEDLHLHPLTLATLGVKSRASRFGGVACVEITSCSERF